MCALDMYSEVISAAPGRDRGGSAKNGLGGAEAATYAVRANLHPTIEYRDPGGWLAGAQNHWNPPPLHVCELSEKPLA